MHPPEDSNLTLRVWNPVPSPIGLADMFYLFNFITVKSACFITSNNCFFFILFFKDSRNHHNRKDNSKCDTIPLHSIIHNKILFGALGGSRTPICNSSYVYDVRSAVRLLGHKFVERFKDWSSPVALVFNCSQTSFNQYTM
jgi:hypothetical protein